MKIVSGRAVVILILTNAMLKDFGRKCFAFTKLDSGTICGINKSVFGLGGKSKV